MEVLAQHLTSLVLQNKEASVRYSQFYGFERNVEHLFYQEASATGFLSVCSTLNESVKGSRLGVLVRTHASHQDPPIWPGVDSQTQGYTWVKFAVGAPLFYERLFSLYHSFPLSSKTKSQHRQIQIQSVYGGRIATLWRCHH